MTTSGTPAKRSTPTTWPDRTAKSIGGAGSPNWENRTLYRGDNLEFMRSMNSKSVHLIATDPPFNKGRDFHATPESLASGASFADRWRWDEDVQPEWLDQIQDDWPAAWAVIDWSRMTYGDDMAAFLCFMGVRLMAMRRILREDGSIYLHCDPTASHYLKTLMDAIFGVENFRNEIIWQRTTGAKLSQHAPKQWGSNSDCILFYAKSSRVHVSPYRKLSDEEFEEKFIHVDEEGRRYFTDGLSIFRRPAHGPRPNLCFEWRGFKNPHPSGWTLSRKRLEEEYQKGNIHIVNGRIERRKYAEDYPGQPCGDVWTDIPNLTGKQVECTGYPTQKPLALYQRIIRASSNPGDIVFDPFAGCATTPIAAEIEGRQWVACDGWAGAYDVVTERLEALKVGSGGQEEMAYYPVAQREEPLVRTDTGETAAPPLKSLRRKSSPPTMKRAEMLKALIARDGMQCQGCGREFDHARYFELDHKLPRSEGGSNELENRVLLCGPCNRTKSNTLTLTGLRKQNRTDGFLVAPLK